MERPAGITALAVLQAVIAGVILVLLVPGLSRQGTWLVMGSPVGAKTFALFSVAQAMALIFFAYSFWHGIRNGFYAYVACKPLGWVAMVLNGVTAVTGVLLVVDVGILGYVVQKKEWFRG